jgi:hypothetical protein
MQHLEVMLPGVDNTVKRELAHCRLKCMKLGMMKGFAVEFAKEDGHVFKAALEEEIAAYKAGLERAAQDPGYVPSTESATLLGREVNHLTLLCGTFAVSYMCRSRLCLFHGDNADWVPHHKNGHAFCCPACKTRYHPMATQNDWTSASYALTWTDTDNDGVQTVQVVPAVYPNSAEEKTLNRLKELYARWAQHGKDGVVGMQQGKRVELDSLLGAFKQNVMFKHHAYNQDSDKWLDATAWPASLRKRVIEEGFWGNFMTPEQVGDDRLFSQWGELIALLEEE